MNEPSKDTSPAPDDIKRKFREALDRKAGGRDKPTVDKPDAVVHPHTGPAKAQRQFRRKSGS